jgi:uncharacterized repeat protein (TIGR02543 family)
MTKQTWRKPLALLLTVLLLCGAGPLAATPALAATAPAGYTAVRTAADLEAARGAPAGSYYLLNDLDLGGAWAAIPTFTGIFDGNGFAIAGLTDSLFGQIAGGEIRNLTLDCDIYSSGLIGAIAGSAVDTAITNCRVSGTVRGVQAGGLLGSALRCEIVACDNLANITASNAAGGIAALSQDSKIEDCTNSGAIFGTGPSGQIGGIAGDSTGTGSIKNCVNNGNISAAGGDVGGVAGAGAAPISGCVNGGAIAVNGANACVGGISGGSPAALTVASCANFGAITVTTSGTATVGGISAAAASVQDSASDATITVTSTGACSIGGIAGTAENVSNCHYSGSLTASVSQSANVGGVAGSASQSLRDCWNSGDVLVNASGASASTLYVGGVAGDSSASVQQCVNTGGVTAYGNASQKVSAGGIAGRQAGNSITSSWNTGAIDGLSGNQPASVGGIAGESDSAITLCWNTGIVDATTDVSDAFAGGIVGQGAAVSESWNQGAVRARAGSNACAGGVSGLGSPVDCFNAGNTSALSSSLDSGQHAWFGDLSGDGSGTVALNDCIEQYVVLYHANGTGVTGIPAMQIKQNGANLTLSSDIPSRTGYNFLGWSQNAAATTAQYQPGGGDSDDENAALYAVWQPKRVMLSFRPGDGGVTPSSQQYNYSSIYGTLPTPAFEGHTFDGWYTAETGGTRIQATDKVRFLSNTPVFARWSKEIYTISFDEQGGNETFPNKTVAYREPYGALPAPTRTGYTFLGWYRTPTALTEVRATTNVTATAYHTLYARWQANDYIVTRMPNGRGGDPVDFTVTYDQTYEKCLTDWAPLGYEMIGWFTEAEGGVEILPTDTVKILQNIKLYPRWKPIQYTITFDVQGGSENFVNKKVAYSTKYGDLPTPTRPGYDFVGWYTRPNDGLIVTKDTVFENYWSDRTLYAHWKGAAHTVTLDPDGGTAPQSVTVYYEETYKALPTPTRAGYTFLGWFTKAGKQVNPSDTVTTFTDETLTARWQVNSYDVTFNPMGGTVSPAKKTVAFGAPYGLPTPDWPGYEFEGWRQNTTDGPFVTEGPMLVAKNQYLYASWHLATYAITLDPMGGTLSAPKVMQITYYDTYRLPDPEPRTGYTFEGWFTEATGGTRAPTGGYSHFDHSQTLYARWKPGQYEAILIDGKNMTRIPITQGAPYGLPTPEPRAGYTFLGWFTAQTDGSKVEPNESVTIANNQFLYARWQANTYTVTFDPRGGTIPASETTMIVTYDQRYDYFPTPVREGYYFSGWHTSPTESSRMDETNAVKTAADHTLYAHWVGDMITFANDAIVVNPRHTQQIAVGKAQGVLHFESRDTRIATVDQSGKILGKRPGTTRIDVTSTEGQVNWLDVTVKYNFWQWLLVIFLFGWIWVPLK